MSQWFYQLLGEEFGPISESGLRQLLQDGTLTGTDLARSAQSATSEWIAISKLTFSAVSSEVEDAEVLTDLDSLNIDFGGSESAAAPAAKKSQTAVAERPAQSNLYFYQFCGQIIGPIPLDTLVRMAEAGRLAETDLVRAEEDFMWQAAAEFSELSAAFLLRMPAESPLKEAPATTTTPQSTTTSKVSTGLENAVPAPAAAVASPVTVAAPAPAPSPTPTAAEASTGRAASQPRSGNPAAKPAKNRGRKKSRGADEKLVENILSEVFADDEEEDETAAETTASQRPAILEPQSSAPSNASAQVTQPAAASAAPSGPRNWSSIGSSAAPASNPSASPAAAARATLKSAPRKSSSSGPRFPFQFNFEFNGPVKALLSLAVIAALWFGYTPLMKYFKTDEARYISRMEMAIDTIEKLNPLTELPKFKGQQELMNREFGAYAALMTEVGSTRQSAKNCLGALNRLLEFSKVDPGNVGLQKKLLDEAKKLIGKYKGE